MKNILEECLIAIKKEQKKRNDILYQSGVDLINYENEYTDVAIKLLVFNITALSKKTEAEVKDWLEWWLFEDVPKIIYFDNKTRELNVEKPKAILKYLIEDK